MSRARGKPTLKPRYILVTAVSNTVIDKFFYKINAMQLISYYKSINVEELKLYNLLEDGSYGDEIQINNKYQKVKPKHV